MSAFESASHGRRRTHLTSPASSRPRSASQPRARQGAGASRALRRPLPATSLYQFLGVTGGGAIAGILIAINASVVVGVILFLLCVCGVALTLKAMKSRGLL